MGSCEPSATTDEPMPAAPTAEPEEEKICRYCFDDDADDYHHHNHDETKADDEQTAPDWLDLKVRTWLRPIYARR